MSQHVEKRFDIVKTPGTGGIKDKGVLAFIMSLLGVKKISQKTYKPVVAKPRKATKIK